VAQGNAKGSMEKFRQKTKQTKKKTKHSVSLNNKLIEINTSI